MEITKEYLDNKFSLIDQRFDNQFNWIKKHFATKDDLTTALANQTKELENYTDDVAKTILEAVDVGFSKLEARLDVLETDMKEVHVRLDRLETPLDKRQQNWYNH